MINREDLAVIKDIPAKKTQIRELQDKSEKLEKTKASISPDTYKQLSEKYRSDLERLESELKEAGQKAEEISVELGFEIEKSEEKQAAASEGLKELDTLSSSGALSQEDAKEKRKQLEHQKRLADKEAEKNRKDLEAVNLYRTAESPEEIRDSKAGSDSIVSGIIDTLKELPKKVYIAAGAGVAGIAIIIILIAALAGGGGGGPLKDFMRYMPAQIIEESGVEINYINMEEFGSSASIRKMLGDDPIEIVNDEVVYRLEDDYYYEGFDPKAVKSFAVFDNSQLDDSVCYVLVDYDREEFIRKLKDQEFERDSYNGYEYYTDSYEAIILTTGGFALCDDDDVRLLLETAAGKSKSVLESDIKEKEFILEFTNSHLSFMMSGGYYDNIMSGGIWQTGNTMKINILVGYPDKQEADTIFKNFNTMMKGLKDSGAVGSFAVDKINDTTLKIMISGITDPEVIEAFF